MGLRRLLVWGLRYGCHADGCHDSVLFGRRMAAMPTSSEPRIVIRVSAAGRQEIAKAAAAAGVPVAQFVRDAALEAASGSGEGRSAAAGSSPAPASPRASDRLDAVGVSGDGVGKVSRPQRPVDVPGVVPARSLVDASPHVSRLRALDSALSKEEYAARARERSAAIAARMGGPPDRPAA